jgi:type II secretion system protein I
MAKRIKNSESGFSLIEVMIALAIFAVYSVAMIVTQSSNIDGSIRLKDNLVLHNLAQMKMNEVLIDVKKFTNATESDPDTGSFEFDGFKDYKYKVEYKKNEFPNFDQLMGQTEDEAGQEQTSAMKKVIFDKLKKNVELMIWQVRVTVTHPVSGAVYDLSSWVTDKDAKLDTNFAL